MRISAHIDVCEYACNEYAHVHTCYLVAIVPPGHDCGVLGGVLTQPEVGLTEIIQDIASSGERERWRETDRKGGKEGGREGEREGEGGREGGRDRGEGGREGEGEGGQLGANIQVESDIVCMYPS